MKAMLNIFSNWRIAALTIIIALAMLLLMCDSDNLAVLLFTKALGLALGYICYRLGKYWDERGLINELNQLSEGI